MDGCRTSTLESRQRALCPRSSIVRINKPQSKPFISITGNRCSTLGLFTIDEMSLATALIFLGLHDRVLFHSSAY